MLGIALNEGAGGISKLQKFRKAHGVTYPLLLDEPGAIITKFGFTGIPQSVVIDPNGKYVAAPESIPGLIAALKKLGK